MCGRKMKSKFELSLSLNGQMVAARPRFDSYNGHRLARQD